MVRATTNPHIQHHDYKPTQDLQMELVSEAIEIAGLDMYYLPKRLVDFDEVYFEDTQPKFDTAYQIPIYIKTSENYLGSEGIMSRFGIEVRLQLILTVSRLHFETLIYQNESTIWRPREGDLIHIPALDHRTYEIKFVDFHPHFYQWGNLPMYDLTVEVWEYGNEILNTGIEAIDCLQKKTSTNAYDWAYLTEDGKAFLTEDGSILVLESFREGQEYNVVDTNDEFQTETSPNNANSIINWTEDNPWGEGSW